MADKKISELVSLAGKDVAATDFFPVVDVSVAETKSLTRDELRNAVNAIHFTATKALATLAAASLPDDTIIEVAADESLSGARTRYAVAAGALVFSYAIPARLSELATIIGATVITVNLQTKLITTSAVRDIYSSNRGDGYIAASQSVAFTSAGNALMYLYVTASEVVGIASAPALPPDTAALIGYIYGQKFYGLSAAGSVLVVGSAGAENNQTAGLAIHRPRADGVLLSDGAITINWQTKLITTVGVSYVQTTDGYITVAGGQSVAFTAASSTLLAWLYVLPTGVVGATQIYATPPVNATILARIYNNKIYSNAPTRNITLVTAAGATVQDYVYTAPADYVTGMMSGDVVVAINMATGTATTAGANGLALWDASYVAVASGQSVSFSTASPNAIRWVYINKTTGTIAVSAAGAPPPVNVNVIVAVYYYGKIYHTSKDSSFLLTNSSGQVVAEAGVAPPFNEAETRAILADDVYLPSSGSLPLYRASCFSNYRVALSDHVKFWLNGGQTTPNAKTFRDIREVIELVPSELESTFELSYRHDAQPNIRYIKPITKYVASPGALTGRSFNLLTIGDSLTEGGMAAAIKSKLVTLGATITTVGTYSSGITAGEIGEGRGVWAWRCFVGKCNNTGGHAISLPSAGTTTTKYQNPFLRLATGTDTAAHPTWCFRNTGNVKEYDFASDPSPGTGDFYIFDFANYLSSRSVAAPDVITIGLSTNDIQLDNGSYTRAERLAAMRLSLDIMVSQIRAALPTAPIAIIPAPAWSSTTQGETYEAEVCDWIENCMTDIRARSDANLYVVPVWQHMARDWVYPTTYVDLSATSKVRKATVSDLIHFGPVGLDQYTQVVAAWAEAVL